jgi:hypothetical protein
LGTAAATGLLYHAKFYIKCMFAFDVTATTSVQLTRPPTYKHNTVYKSMILNMAVYDTLT